MIYWPLEPGAEYDIAIPLLSPLSEAEKQGGSIIIVLRNDVGRWDIDGHGWDWYFSPAWVRIPISLGDDFNPNNWPPSGEYTYEAYIEVAAPDTPEDYSYRLLSKGIAIFGDYKDPQPGQYEQEIAYNQYGETILQ